MTAAQWISPSTATVSSLQTGRACYIVAWGGSEFGYAYTYSISGAPSGVTIDSETGILNVATALAVGSYPFSVTSTNRKQTTEFSVLPFTLVVVAGISSGTPTGTQIRSKTYDPFSGTFGTPPSAGGDWTTILDAIQTAVIADQVTFGDGRLYATIPFRRGTTYNYTDNHWLTGMQWFDCIDDPAFPTGALPILRNNGIGTFYEGGPLNIGVAGAMSRQDGAGIKALSALIHSANIGDTTVTLKTGGDASRLIPGRWHVIMCGDQQIGGYPPNVTYFDYVKVVSVVGSVVTIDRPLRYYYSENYYEVTSSDQSFGRAWIVPWDIGGSAGTVPAYPRQSIHGGFLNINFQANPNGSAISLMQGFIDLSFVNCTVQNLQPTMSKHVLFSGITIANDGEVDKIIETCMFINCTSGATTPYQEVGGASGVEYLFLQGCYLGCWQCSPRQIYSLNTTHDAAANTDLSRNWSWSFNGPIMYARWKGCTFLTGPQTDHVWTYHGSPYAPIIIGTDAVWSGSQLQIPSSFAQFESWLMLYPGAIISTTGTPPYTTNWGIINEMTSPGDGSALWLNITWINGTKPTSGNIYPNARYRELVFESDNVFGPAMGWEDPGFAKQTSTPFQSNYDFPSGGVDTPVSSNISSSSQSTITPQADAPSSLPVSCYSQQGSSSTIVPQLSLPGLLTLTLTITSATGIVITSP